MTRRPELARRRSLLSLAAVMLPLLGAVFGDMIVFFKPPGDAGWPQALLGPLVFPASTVCGMIFSAVAIARRESFRALAWIALVLNGALLVYGIVRL